MPQPKVPLRDRKKLRSASLKRLRHDDVPATTGLVKEVRVELLSEIYSFRHDVDGRFKGIDARFKGIDGQFNRIDARFKGIDGQFNRIDARFKGIDARFDDMEARFDTMDAKIEKSLSIAQKSLSVAHGTKVLMEEQRAENRIVLDGLKTMIERQDRNDDEHREFRQTLQLFLRAKDVHSHS